MLDVLKAGLAAGVLVVSSIILLQLRKKHKTAIEETVNDIPFISRRK